LADNNRNQRIQVSLGDRIFSLRKSRANGHFHGNLEIPDNQLPQIPTSAGHWITFRALTKKDDPRIFDAKVLLLPDTGLSVISDIDDTLKISEVTDRRKLLHNTLLNVFACVPGMSDLYQLWQKQFDAAFHFVSASPWHLYPCLSEFLHAQHFPAGS